METVREVREDPLEELAESDWPAKGGYGWAYLQAFRVLCQSLYLEPSPYAFLYFYDARPRQPTTWLSLISRPSISRLDAFSQSFKHFKVVVKEEGKPYFLNADGSTKFPFSWTGTPSRYKDMGMDELSVGDKEVVKILMKFVDKLPTKGLVRVYNSVHPIIDIEGHMAQSEKKNLALFQSLRKEMAAKAKAAGKTDEGRVAASIRQGEGREESESDLARDGVGQRGRVENII
ncbi:hypothetical protein DEO72_LG3g2004 [Vigna unguiculata]|uniref:Transposase n=1 Tax=Vigna unguiculata TaxID=3917 RepID=A0A4D6LG38_VIGUN|nr:hypothetical protein DEO72_LG3g2004 [Vigna unguiculata]